MDEHHASSGSEATDDGRDLRPEEAATLLEQAARRARRQLDTRPPLLSLLGAALFLVAFGAVWWSVRRQHPYGGPSGWALGALYGIVAVWAVAVTTVRRRATSGLGGRFRRRQRIESFAYAAVWISVYVFQGALAHAGAGRAIVYGIYPATAPFIVVGGAAAAHSAARENWPNVGLAVTAIAVGVGAAFAGPSAVWLVMGIGLSAVLVGLAAVQFRQHRLAPARP